MEFDMFIPDEIHDKLSALPVAAEQLNSAQQ